MSIRSLFITASLIIPSIIIGIFFRLYPAGHNLGERDINNAQLIVYVTLEKNIRNSLDIKFPNTSVQEKEQTVKKLFAATLIQNKKEIQKAIKTVALNLQKGRPRTPYLLESDPYYYLGLTNNLFKDGTIGGPRKGNKYFNPLMMAPSGEWYAFDVHPYVGFALYKISHFFNTSVPVEVAVSFVPLVLFVIAVFGLFFVYRSLKLGFFAFLLGMIYFACIPYFILRSSYGWYDTDPYNVIFPLFSIGCILAALNATTFNKKLLFLFAGCIICSLYSLFWRGWIYLPIFIFFGLLALWIIATVRKKDALTIRFLTLSLFIYPLVTFLAAILLTGFEGVVDSFSDSFSIINTFENARINVWPDVFITVGELKRPEWIKVKALLGGAFPLCMALCGILYSVVSIFRKKSADSYSLHYAFLAVVAIFLGIMSSNAERFTLLSVTTMAFFFALGIQSFFLLASGIAGFFAKTKTPSSKIPRPLPPIVFWILCSILSVLMISQFVYAHKTARAQFSIFNQTWEQALLDIREKTPPDAIVNSWWCPGHFIKTVANRRVTFDGATMNTPQAYWMSQFFLSDNERLGLGILRMLNASGNKAYETLIDMGMSPADAIDLLHAILPLSQQQASGILSQRFSVEKARSILALTHGAVPASYCFLYDDLMKGVIGLAYLGNWDFHKIEALQKVADTDQARIRKFLNRGSKENVSLLWYVSGGQKYEEQEAYPAAQTAHAIIFSNGVSINPTTLECTLSRDGKTGSPYSIVYMENGILKEKVFTDYKAKISVLLIKKEKGYSCILADRQYLRSLLFRLYYLNGEGLSFFKKFGVYEDILTRTRIFVYEVDWKNLLASESH